MKKKKLSKKTKRIIISLVLVVAVVAGVCYFAFKPEEKLQVETAKATHQTISETLDTSGTVASASQEIFSLPGGVKVTKLNVKEGDIVEAGDVIATFDLASLDKSLNEKKTAYEKAQSAYKSAQEASKNAKAKISEVKVQISELESEIERLTDKSKNETADSAVQSKPAVSDEVIKRFIGIAKLFGADYTEDEAGKILSGILDSGSSDKELSSFLDNLGAIAGTNGSFDLSAFSGMTQSSELMSAEMSLLQLKGQLATLELQADDTYISTFKTVADKAEESYLATKAQIDSMKKGWIASDKGIVTEVNITSDGTFKSGQSASSMDISSILSAATSGADITSLLTTFMGQNQAAVKIIYYPLVADISLSKYDVLEVDLDQDVIIKPASGSELSGKVSYISAVATSSNGLNIGSIMGGSASSSVIPAQITFENVDDSVIVGVDVQVSIITQTVDNALVVPVEVLCIDGEDIFVYVLEDGKAVKKNVELGISSDTHYQITSGISESDILIKNTFGLEEGVSVEPK